MRSKRAVLAAPVPPAEGAGWFGPATRQIALPLLAYRCSFFGLICLCRRLLPNIFSEGNYRLNFHWPAEALPGPAAFLKTWDAQHYLFLSQHGYAGAGESARFFPLWPLAIKVGSYLCFGHPLVAALVLANLFSFIGVLLFHDLVARNRGSETADASALLLLAFPGALFFALPYAESLFFLLCVLLFHALSRGRTWPAALAAFCLPLARPVGALAAIPLFLILTTPPRRRPAGWGQAGGPLIAIGLGLVVFFQFMRLNTGDILTIFKVYGSLHTANSMSRVFAVPDFLMSLFSLRELPPPLDLTVSLIDRMTFLLFLTAAWRLWRTDRFYFWFALPLGLISSMSATSFTGVTRFTVVIFPIFIAAGAALSGETRRGWRALALAVLFAVQIALLIRHINNWWVA